MKISIVIPVYNEASSLAACLQAIGSQNVAPYEVIVVDNNSTDETAAVASLFPFVKLLTETKQGVVHARNTGFNTARGTIIGRIDADTLLPEDWTQKVLKIFKDKSITAVSGSPNYYDFALQGFADAADHKLRGHLSEQLGDINFLWGANMAMRRSAWLKVRKELCNHADLHEDFDLGIHLQQNDYYVAYDATLKAGVSSRRIDSGFWAFVRYTLASPRTYAKHGLHNQRHMYPVLFLCWLAWLPGRAIYRGYNFETGEFSIKQLVAPTTQRVDPTTHVA
jgi:glycosyltransferase involved in cell wall biosynthesis